MFHWQDIINGCYELFGAPFIFLSLSKLLKEKKVKGVSWLHVLFFTAWGYWNLYYYPYLNQWYSFAGGIGIVIMNTVWLVALIYYSRGKKMKQKRKATIAIDFDGVIHSFKSGWQGHRRISDLPVEGAIEWLKMLIHSDKVVPSIYSARSWRPFGNYRMKKWLIKYGLTEEEAEQLKFWRRKPADDFVLDDRCEKFSGEFPSIDTIIRFEPWHGHTVFGD